MDSNWGSQDASHPKEGEMRREDEVKSLLGVAVIHLGGPVDWSCHREKRTSRSVCESEVKAMDEGSKTMPGLRHFFKDIGASHISQAAPLMLADNQGGMAWCDSEAIAKKMRHVDILEVSVRDSINRKEVQLSHTPGVLNSADGFTKEMKDGKHFVALRSALMSRRGTMQGAAGMKV